MRRNAKTISVHVTKYLLHYQGKKHEGNGNNRAESRPRQNQPATFLLHGFFLEKIKVFGNRRQLAQKGGKSGQLGRG